MVVAAGGAWAYGSPAVAAGIAVAALIAQGALLFVVVRRYHAARADSSLWQSRTDEARIALERLQEHALYADEETGVGNARQLEIDFVKSVARARRRHEPFALAIIQVNHVLRRDGVDPEAIVGVAGVLLAVARAEDTICRVDNRLFAALLSGADAEGASRFVERVRTVMAARMFQPGASLRLLEIRGGVAQWSDDMETLDVLGRQARRDLDRESAHIAIQASEFAARAG